MKQLQNYFEKFGLTQYEAACLAAISSHHDISAQRISEDAEVPYTKVYGVLGALEKQGFLKTTLERPKKYSPVSPESILSILMSRKQKELDYLKELKDPCEVLLEKTHKKGERYSETGPVTYLPSKEAVWDMMYQFTQESKKSVKGLAGIVTAKEYFSDKKQGVLSLELCRRGVNVEVIWPQSFNFFNFNFDGNHLQFFINKNTKFRVTDKLRQHPELMIVDNKKALVSFVNPQNSSITSGIILNDEPTVLGYVDYFEKLWADSKPISNFILGQIKSKVKL